MNTECVRFYETDFDSHAKIFLFQAKISFLITDIEIIGFAKLVEVKAVSHLYISIFFRKYLFYICMTNIFFSYRSLLELDAPVVSIHVMQHRKKKSCSLFTI